MIAIEDFTIILATNESPNTTTKLPDTNKANNDNAHDEGTRNNHSSTKHQAGVICRILKFD